MRDGRNKKRIKRSERVATLLGACLTCFVLMLGFVGCEARSGVGKGSSLSGEASINGGLGEGQDRQGQVSQGNGSQGQGNEGQGQQGQSQSGADDQAVTQAEFSIEFEEEEMEAFRRSLQFEKVHVTIPGMKGSKTLVYLSDLHVIADTTQVAAADLENVELRRNHWSAYDGMTAADAWTMWVDYLNAVNPEGVLLGADIVDFASKANVECLKTGLERLDIPWVYVRADHDLAPSYLDGVFEKDSLGYQQEIKGYRETTAQSSESSAGAKGISATNGDFADVMTMEFADFIVAGWNDSTAQMTPDGLARMKEAFAKGKPVILLTHVPIQPLAEGQQTSSPSLTAASQAAWGGRALLWGRAGTGTFYVPNETTAEFLEMIYSDDTPVVEILCGHLHFSWDGQVTPRVHEHVFGAAMERHVGVVTISAE